MTHKLLRDFDIWTDFLISARRPDLIIINQKKKRICKIVDFAVSADHKIKLKQCEKEDKYLDLARELKKLLNMQVTIIAIRTGGVDGWQTGGDHPNDSIIENDQNTKNSPGDVKRIAIT